MSYADPGEPAAEDSRRPLIHDADAESKHRLVGQGDVRELLPLALQRGGAVIEQDGKGDVEDREPVGQRRPRQARGQPAG